MITVDLDVPKALALLEECVTEKGPDFVYKPPGESPQGFGACLYVHDRDGSPAPGCLIGHVLHKAGVSYDDLASLDRGGAIGACVEAGYLHLSPTVVEVLARAQALQDRERPWAAAVRGAKQRAEELLLPTEG